MITLTTGQPGAGKSLYTLFYVHDLALKDNRQVYYNGIPDLKIPNWIELDKPEDWFKVPAGSVIVLDEAQRLFRPRGNGAAVPEYVSKLETHRHDGLDLFVITQHPMLIDTNVRRLVGRHFHVQRTFGMQRATVHEFPDLRQEPDKSREGSIRHDFAYPKEVFNWYKSAEVHTVKRRIPFRLFVLFLIPVLLAGLTWATVVWWEGKGKKHESRDAPAAPLSVTSVNATPSASTLTTGDYLAQFQPRIPGLPHTSPAFDKINEVKTSPVPRACVASSKRCTCYTDQATEIAMDDSLCRQIADHGFFDPSHVPAVTTPISQSPPSIAVPPDLNADSPVGEI